MKTAEHSPDGYLLGIGAANIDLSGAIREKVSLRDSNAGNVVISVGGVTHNILSNFVRMGGEAKMITSVGEDSFAPIIEKDLRDTGIDVSHIIRVPGAASAVYMAVLDDGGDLYIGVNALGIHANTIPRRLEKRRSIIEGASAIVCDTSIPAESLAYLAGEAAVDKAVFVDPVSVGHARKLRGIVGLFHTVTPNLIELEEMSGIKVNGSDDLHRAASVLLEQGTKRVIVTLGSEGCYCEDQNGTVLRKKFRPVERMENATGAGDAFLGGVLYGYLSGLDTDASLDMGLASGIIAISSRATIHPQMSMDLIRQTILEYKQ